jgi:hypothetical protein
MACFTFATSGPAPALRVVGLDLQPDRPGAAQELAFIGHVAVEEHDVKVIAQPNEISFGIRFRDFAAENVTAELPDTLAVLMPNQNRRVIPNGDLCRRCCLRSLR